MSLTKLTPDDFEYFALEAHPKKTYTSSSAGVTGSVHLFARRSDIEKEVVPLSVFSSSLFQDTNLEGVRKVAVENTSSNITSDVNFYMQTVSDTQVSQRKQQQLEIFRFTPPFRLNSNFLRKDITRKHLMPYYRPSYPSAHYAVANYNSVNFFTGSSDASKEVPSGSVMLYPNVNEQYSINDAFSFDFFIKPTMYENVGLGEDGGIEHMKAGAVFHLSGAYCVSLHTGSYRDHNAEQTGFRIGFQYGADTDTPPSEATNIILSTDNSLTKNQWHHVTIRWGGPNYNHGSGSIIIDNAIDTRFVIDTSLVLPGTDVLCVGNYYEGTDTFLNQMNRFFGNDTSVREGLVELNSSAGFFAPDDFAFTHPLVAEVHDLKLYDKYLTLSESIDLSTAGPKSLDNLRFYLPPFFTEESPYRQNVGTFGGVLVTPFYEQDGTTTAPFAEKLAFSCGGMYMNLENYSMDLATGNFPRLWELTGSAWLPPSTIVESANDFLFSTGSNIKRQYTILPCDNGSFVPNFDLLSLVSSGSKLVNDLGNPSPGLVTLNDIVPSYFPSRAIQTTGSILDEVLGAQPDNLGTLPGDSLSILHRTRDNSSNQVVLFDISNMFYGMQMNPGTFKITSPQMKHNDKLGITLKDDGNGNLYRAPYSGSYDGPTWASVGNIFYNEGIVMIKHPSLYFFGETNFEMEFEGVQNVHVMTINAFARPMMQTSSSNPSFMEQPNDGLANNPDQDFVYITGVNIHDENLNVITRAKLAQPIVKRTGDKLLFKVKLDF